MNCKNHQTQTALYFCPACSSYFCGTCTDIRRFSEQFTAYVCKECGGKIEAISDKGSAKKQKPSVDASSNKPSQEKEIPKEKKIASAPQTSANLWLSLPSAVLFPLRGKGIVVTLLNAGLFWGLLEICRLYPLIGPVPMFFYLTFFIVYGIKIIEDTIAGFDALTNFPNIHYWLGAAATFIYLTVSLLVALAPAHIYLLATHDLGIVYFSLLAAGLFFIPMLLIRAILMKNIQALNPVLFLASIFRTFLAYVVTFAVLAGLLYAYSYLNTEYISWTGNFEVILRALLLVYIVFMQTRILGLFARLYKHRIAEAS